MHDPHTGRHYSYHVETGETRWLDDDEVMVEGGGTAAGGEVHSANDDVGVKVDKQGEEFEEKKMKKKGGAKKAKREEEKDDNDKP